MQKLRRFWIGIRSSKFSCYILIFRNSRVYGTWTNSPRKKGYESDMWAVGICTYEMLFGIPPYYDETPEKKIFQKITGSFEIDWMGEPASDIVKDLIMKLLDHNFQSRLSLKEAMHHPFFSEIDWSNPPKVNLPERVGIFDERNKEIQFFQYYNKATLSTEVVAFGDGVYNQNTSVDNQIELLKLFL